MSWAAKRVTRRPEDMAYCLLGLFGISTPMLYGEGGERAFVRLQEEIIKDSNDMSIFAWKEELSSVVMYHTDTKETSVPLRGILAKSPREFLNAHYYKIDTGRNSSAEYAMTNKGLRMTVELELGRQDSLPLNCYIKKTNYNVPVPLAIVLEARANGVYARRDAQSLTTSTQPSRGVAKLIYVSKLSVGSVKWAVEKHSRVQIRFEYVKLQKDHFSCDVIGRGPDERWDTTSEAFHMAQYQYSLTCYERIIWRSQTGESGEFAVIAGVDASKKPWACVATMKHTPALYHAVQRNEIISIERHRNEAALPKYVLKSKWPKSICAHLSLQKAETLEGSQVRFKYLVTVKVQNEVGR
jgi:hypothetical protein